MSTVSLFLVLLLLCPQCSTRPIRKPPRHLELLLTVKTTRKNHGTRLLEAMDTWARADNWPPGTRVLFVSDSSSFNQQFALGRQSPPQQRHQTAVLNSGCPVGHRNDALCCKMAFELRLALDGRQRTSQEAPDFWCHFDDDSFVLLSNLAALLRQFPPHQDLYIGRASTAEPISLALASHSAQTNDALLGRKFWFGTGGAGFCLSQSTLGKLRRFVADQQHFQTICAQLGIPDDVTLGFVLSNLIGVNLTNSERFHSHLERLDSIPQHELIHQITLSASPTDERNVVNVPMILPPSVDPMRFRSLQHFIRKEEGNRS